MIAVIFEVEIKDKKIGEYLDIASALKEELANVDGFITVERFQSLANSNKYLSLSLWRDLESINSWKSNKCHLSAQNVGKTQLFKDYKISIYKQINTRTMNGS